MKFNPNELLDGESKLFCKKPEVKRLIDDLKEMFEKLSPPKDYNFNLFLMKDLGNKPLCIGIQCEVTRKDKHYISQYAIDCSMYEMMVNKSAFLLDVYTSRICETEEAIARDCLGMEQPKRGWK